MGWWFAFLCFPGELRSVVETIAHGVNCWAENEYGEELPLFFDRYTIPFGENIDAACLPVRGIQNSLIFVPFISHHVVSRVLDKADVEREVEQRSCSASWQKSIVPVIYDTQGQPLYDKRTLVQGRSVSSFKGKLQNLEDEEAFPYVVRKGTQDTVQSIIQKLCRKIAACVRALKLDDRAHPDTSALAIWRQHASSRPGLDTRLAISRFYTGDQPFSTHACYADGVPTAIRDAYRNKICARKRMQAGSRGLTFVYLTAALLNDEAALKPIVDMIVSTESPAAWVCLLFAVDPHRIAPQTTPCPPHRAFLAGRRGVVKGGDETDADFGKRVASIVHSMFNAGKRRRGKPRGLPTAPRTTLPNTKL